jgi:hypothetical protein
MTSISLRALAVLWACVTPLAFATPPAAAAQSDSSSAQGVEGLPDAAPASSDPAHDEALVCAATDEARGEVWRRAIESRQLEEEDAEAVLDALADSLAVEVVDRPDDVTLQYELALVLGLRADLEDGRDQVRAAEALDRQIEVVLALDPEHTGGQYLRGRLQASVLRMGGFKRFIATRILGGDRLGDASWEDARLRLEAAVAGDPCVPDYHYELARLYRDRGEPELAARQLERLFAVTGSRELFADVLAKGERLAEELERP